MQQTRSIFHGGECAVKGHTDLSVEWLNVRRCELSRNSNMPPVSHRYAGSSRNLLSLSPTCCAQNMIVEMFKRL